MGLELRRRQELGRLEGRLELVRGWWVAVVVAVLGMERGLGRELLLVKVRVSLGREGSVHWDRRRRHHELGTDQ